MFHIRITKDNPPSLDAQILKFFEEHSGEYISGEELASRLYVSRNAVWKAVGKLRQRGYHIDSVTNKGYCLTKDNDIISADGVKKYLQYAKNADITVLESVSSTNSAMRELAEGGAKEGSVIISREQSVGRGRLGRSFYSPKDTGVYMSLLLRPTMADPTAITAMAAVAVCEAIETLTDEKPQIKWVNDIFIGGKKVCGILTEGFFGFENGSLEYAVLGVGMNVYPPQNGFPAELEGIAGSILSIPQSDMKNKLTAKFIDSFYRYYTESRLNCAEEYRKRSMAIGREVTLKTRGTENRVLVKDIDDKCRLIVKYADGREECCSTGEIFL